MDSEQLNSIWRRAAADPAYGERLWTDPEGVADSEGLDETLTDELLRGVRVGREGRERGVADWRLLQRSFDAAGEDLPELSDDELVELVTVADRRLPRAPTGLSRGAVVRWLENLRVEIGRRDLLPSTNAVVSDMISRLR